MRMLCLLPAALTASGQVFEFTREQLIRYTAQNPFERFPDGRPKVPDALLEKMRGLSMEDVWSVLQGPGFVHQYEGGWQVMHPGKKLVGRAITAQFMPLRPDVNSIVMEDGKAKGYKKGQHQWVIDMVQPGDVLVIDAFTKLDGGGMVGNNLATAIWARSRAGFVIDGAIRDLEGIFPLGMPVYYRAAHPSAITGVMLTAVNTPVRIGKATVMPGDVVLGDREGVYFIPPQFVQKILEVAEVTQVRDEWNRQKLMTGKYKSSEIYSTPEDPALKKELDEYIKKRLGK